MDNLFEKQTPSHGTTVSFLIGKRYSSQYLLELFDYKVSSDLFNIDIAFLTHFFISLNIS